MVVPTRRERLRQELTHQIKQCATRQLAEGGAAAVTLRGIARELGVSPAALYSYFDSLDALFTELIADGFNDLADAVAGAVDAAEHEDLAARMLAGLRAYRRWALEHPAQFRLLYFSPVPGYEAPEDGPTLLAALRVVVPFLRILRDGWERGLLPQPDPGPPVDAHEFHDTFGLHVTSDQLRSATECWGTFHGLVALELSGHISEKWVDPAALYEADVVAMMRRIGLEPR